jgi:glycosyltransferase involved in cell wall biosynthesis
MKKIKVLQFPAGLPTGGKTRYMLENWNVIDKNRFQFDFATFLPKLAYEEDLKRQGCEVHHFSCYAEDDRERFAAEFNAALDAGYDAIHLHTGYWHDFACEEIAIKRNVPIIAVHAHNNRPNVERGSFSFEEALEAHERKREEFCPELATHFLACSRAAADFLYGSQIPKEKIQIMNNAIELGRYAYNPETREKKRNALGIVHSFAVGHVGRFAYQKNHDFLIEAFADAAKELPNAVLLLIGEGELREGIEGKANALGLKGKVRFLGGRGDVAELYQAMDIFVLPSRFEGLPIAMIEAQTSGLKCLAADTITDEARITDNLRFLPIEPQTWSDAIVEAANSAFERRDCSAQVAAAGYSITEQIKILERIYAGE